MSEAELHGLINGHLDGAYAMVDFWLSVTFAVILARFFGSAVLSRRVLRIITGLYLLATALTVTRYLALLLRALDYEDRLIAGGFDPFYWPRTSLPVGPLIIVLYVVGTWTTVRFLVGAWAPSAGNATEGSSSSGGSAI